jgi:ABC-type sugar transport system substrate-binding protein
MTGNLYPTPNEREARRDIAPEAWRQQLAADYRATFATEQGGRVLLDLLRRTGVMKGTYDPNDPTADGMKHREGQRAIGLYIVALINEHPDAALRLAATGDVRGVFQPQPQDPFA